MALVHRALLAAAAARTGAAATAAALPLSLCSLSSPLHAWASRSSTADVSASATIHHHHLQRRGFASATANSDGSAAAASGSGGGAGGVGGGDAADQLQVQVEPLADALEGVSVVTLARADARNAIGRQLLRELREAVDLLRQERTTRCVVLRSSVPGVFCAGADLKERSKMTQQETLEFVGLLRRTMSEVQALPMPTIAAIEGFALGGGAELALAADIRVAGAGAVFSFPEAQLGIIPGAGGTQRLPRLVGASRAKELIFTARRVKADEAVDIGLVDHMVPEGQAHSRALEIAALIAKSAPLSLRMAKAAINHGLEVDLSTGLHMEEAYYAQLVPTKDRLEGLKAFAEKRPPVYKGE